MKQRLGKTFAAAGLAALLSTPIFAEEPPELHSCNGQLGSSRQAILTYEGRLSTGEDVYNVKMHCLTQTPLETFIDLYHPDNGSYLGSIGSSGDTVGFQVPNPQNDMIDVSFEVNSYESFDPNTGVYSGLLGRDTIRRWRNLHNPELAEEGDGGDFPLVGSDIVVQDWFGSPGLADQAISPTEMTEHYIRGNSLVEDDVTCTQVYVNGMPYDGSGSQVVAECRGLFADGFESGGLDAWSSSSGL